MRIVGRRPASLLDLLAEFTAAIYGHSDPTIRAAIDDASTAASICPATIISRRAALVLCERLPRSNARALPIRETERTSWRWPPPSLHGPAQIMVFEGGYHGGVLNFPPGGSRVNVPMNSSSRPITTAMRRAPHRRYRR